MSPSIDGGRRTLLKTTGAALAVGALAGCSGAGEPDESDDSPEEQTTTDGTTVEVGPNGEFVFSPGTEEPLHVDAGTTVAFVWRSDTHNVEVESQPEGANWQGVSEIRNAGYSTEFTFEVAGTYEYVCTPHESLGMTGRLVVE